ncbi:hypothetical protein ACFL1X_06035, partial [Candidatus Hydrogenedentota bacterium]
AEIRTAMETLRGNDLAAKVETARKLPALKSFHAVVAALESPDPEVVSETRRAFKVNGKKKFQLDIDSNGSKDITVTFASGKLAEIRIRFGRYAYTTKRYKNGKKYEVRSGGFTYYLDNGEITRIKQTQEATRCDITLKNGAIESIAYESNRGGKPEKFVLHP